MSYTVPHYVTIGVNLMLRSSEGKVLSVAFAVDELGEGGIEAEIDKVVLSAMSRGLCPLTETEYDAWARELAVARQQERLVQAMQARAEARAIDPARLDALLAAHKGAPGGDA